MGKKGKKRGKGAPDAPAVAEAKPAPAKVDADAGATPQGPGPDEATPVVPARADVTAPEAAAAPRPDTDRQTNGSSDRRLFRRVPFFRKVEYRFQTMDDFKSRFANDLSLGGMFIKTEEPEPMGTVIFLQFDLQDGSKILSGYGKVVRVNPKGGLPEFDPGMGIEFLKFDDESLQRIKVLVAERFSSN